MSTEKIRFARYVLRVESCSWLLGKLSAIAHNAARALFLGLVGHALEENTDNSKCGNPPAKMGCMKACPPVTIYQPRPFNMEGAGLHTCSETGYNGDSLSANFILLGVSTRCIFRGLSEVIFLASSIRSQYAS